MTKKEAVINYLEKLNAQEWAELLEYLNIPEDMFEELAVYGMADFDEFFRRFSPMEIAEKITWGEGFNPYDDYFRVDVYENISSIDEDAFVEECLEEIEVVADYLMNHYVGDLPTKELTDILWWNDYEE